MMHLTPFEIGLYSALFTVVIEAITLLFRFGLDIQATRDTASTVGVLTGGIRIHHGYLGAVALPIAAVVAPIFPLLGQWGLIAGISLIASDLIHHFCVLWPLVGHHEFDLVYED